MPHRPQEIKGKLLFSYLQWLFMALFGPLGRSQWSCCAVLLLHNESYSALTINIQVQFMTAFVTKDCNKKSEKSLLLERLARFGMGNEVSHTIPWSWCLTWTTAPSTAIKITRKLQSLSHLTDQIAYTECIHQSKTLCGTVSRIHT